MFSPTWLELREPVDHRSRAGALTDILHDAWRRHGWTRVVDLGSGTGSNLRYLSPRLSGVQAWTLLDHDPGLLRRVPPVAPPISVRCVAGTLEREGVSAAANADIVTASALLDLVDEECLARVIHASCESGGGVYFALSYNGRVEWGGRPDPDDEMIRLAVNAHQQRDQGDRIALGPAASTAAERVLTAEGYQTWREQSPWRLTSADRALAHALVDGWEQAALERAESAEQVGRIRAWAVRRREAARDPALSLHVGHDDLLGLPPTGD